MSFEAAMVIEFAEETYKPRCEREETREHQRLQTAPHSIKDRESGSRRNISCRMSSATTDSNSLFDDDRDDDDDDDCPSSPNCCC